MAEEALQCAACLRRVRSGTRFCPVCGHAVGAAAPEALEPVAALEPGAAVAAPSRAARFAEQWEELKRVVWLFGLLLASTFGAGLAARSNATPWPVVVASAVDAAIVLAVTGLRLPKLRFLFRLHPIGSRAWLQLGGLALATGVLLTVYFWALERAGVPTLQVSKPYTDAGWPLWAILLMVSVTPAVFEEIAFRGVIQSTLERILNARDAWLIQAALFSVSHLSPIIFPSHFALGLCFGYLRWRSRSIYPSMLMHALWNAFVLYQELAG